VLRTSPALHLRLTTCAVHVQHVALSEVRLHVKVGPGDNDLSDSDGGKAPMDWKVPLPRGTAL